MSSVFVASILGSLHCVGMCGPFALIAGAHQNLSESSSRNARPFRLTLAYHLGRLITYSVIGLLFGWVGMILNQGLAFASWQQSAAVVAGILMVVVGLVALLRAIGFKVRLPAFARPLQSILQASFSRLLKTPPVTRAFLIGTFSCLMPCGWLYTFAIAAAGTGSPLWGMFLMFAFWAGTVPVLCMLILGMGRASRRVQAQIPFAMACLVIGLGCYTITCRASIAFAEEPVIVQSGDQVQEQLQQVDHNQLPCCQHP